MSRNLPRCSKIDGQTEYENLPGNFRSTKPNVLSRCNLWQKQISVCQNRASLAFPAFRQQTVQTARTDLSRQTKNFPNLQKELSVNYLFRSENFLRFQTRALIKTFRRARNVCRDNHSGLN